MKEKEMKVTLSKEQSFSASIARATGEPIKIYGDIKPLEVTESGIYKRPRDIDGYNPVVVRVPQPELEDLTATENGVYKSDMFGYNQVTVDVQPVLDEVIFTTNGIYASPMDIDGWNKVTVSIPSEYEDYEVMRW